ncbi:AraC family ligand binding domain-containing protein [Bacteroides ovatus]|uniref:AraC family ligand binding domain-containing protein n=1 Tax=Bacteroides ovatus TaxID=28116 RepID=UPI0020A78970
MLLCTAGKGWYQEQGQAARELQAGDVVVIRPGVVHWHGASSSHEFSHLSVIPNPEKNKDTWLEAVNEEDYQLLK